MNTIVKLANFYGVSTDYLLGNVDNGLTVEAAIMSIKQYNGQTVSDQDREALIAIAKAYFESKKRRPLDRLFLN